MTEHETLMEVVRLKDAGPLPLVPGRTALVVVDVQRYFVRPADTFGRVFEALAPGVTSGYFGRVDATVLPNIRRLLAAFRSAGWPVVYTATGCRLAGGGDLVGWLKRFDELGLAVLGSRVWPQVGEEPYQIDDRVAPRPDELVVHKTSSGPLNSTRLDQTLRNLGVESLVVSGLTTDVCVTQTAREFADRGFPAVVAGDACTTLSEELHRAALEVFALAFGSVKSTEALLAWLAAALDQPALGEQSPRPLPSRAHLPLN